MSAEEKIKKYFLLVIYFLCLIYLIYSSIAKASVNTGNVKVYLNVPSLIALTIFTPSIVLFPTPEDYAKEFNASNYITFSGQKISPSQWPPSPYPEWLPGTNSGWLERSEAISLSIFTNSQNGATLYVYGIAPEHQNRLYLKDCFITVDTPKTFIWKNKLEGASARVSTPNPDNFGIEVPWKQFIPPPPWLDNEIIKEIGSESQWWEYIGKEILISKYPWLEDIPEDRLKEVAESFVYVEGLYTPGEYIKVGEGYFFRPIPDLSPPPPTPNYLQLSNPSILWIFSVNKATAAPRKIVFQIGIGNLDFYTEGEYTNTIVFILMPNV
jgi:hypothetical protein